MKFRGGGVEMRLIVWKILLRNVGKPSLVGCLDLDFSLEGVEVGQKLQKGSNMFDQNFL